MDVSRAAPRFDDADPQDWPGLGPWHYPIHGVDVSRYQGTVDWRQVRASGVSFAFVKATEGGDRVDDRFAENWQAARRAGVARGAYHYFYFCRPAIEQAAWFAHHVPNDRAALPPVLDLEWNHRSPSCPLRPEPAAVRHEAIVFLQAMSDTYGKRPIIYTTLDFYRENDLARIGGADFWLRSVADHPSATYPGQAWTFWQYSGTGVVSGIAGPADLNAFAGSQPQWRAWLSSRSR